MIDWVHWKATRLPRLAAPYYRDVLWRMPDRSKIAYLTFDDGPTPFLTGTLLDLLARFDLPACFFLLGRHAKRDPGLVRAIVQGKHTFGNHTYSHPDPWKTSEHLLLDELERTTALLEELTQAPVRWMRPPYGHLTPSIRRWCHTNQQRCTMWDISPCDFLPTATPAILERRIRRALRPGSIIVLHDNRNALRVTPDALNRVLPRLLDEGWQFKRLS